MTSIFDPNEFLNATTTEAGQRRPPLSTDYDYIAIVGEPRPPRQHAGKEDPSKLYTFIDYPLAIDLTSNPAEHKRIGQDTVTINHSMGIDLTDGGAMDWSAGRNSQMTALREATGTNAKGQAWSPMSVVGRTIRVKIRHEEYPKGSGILQDRIRSVAKV
jgi:hypothetical protein